MNDTLARLVARKLAGEATAEEELQLQQLLQENAGEQYLAGILAEYWRSRRDVSPSADPMSDAHFAHILKLADLDADQSHVVNSSTPSFSRKLKRFSLAAALAITIGISAWWLTSSNAQSDKPATPVAKTNQVIARKGARTHMVLPDSTKVWLNADSKLTYDAVFNNTIREVTLEGEAYFVVARNPNRPFVVNTPGIAVRVLGTAFNVKSYPQDATIETTLIHGSIEVLNKKEPTAPRIILRPHEKLVFNKEEHTFTNTSGNDKPLGSPASSAIAITALPRNIPDTALIETSWVYNRLLFEGDTFRELAVKMERWFNVRISFSNDKVANYRLRGVFDNETVEEALRALQVIASFHYKINGNDVEISR
jgi:transmembrane sensor